MTRVAASLLVACTLLISLTSSASLRAQSAPAAEAGAEAAPKNPVQSRVKRATEAGENTPITLPNSTSKTPAAESPALKPAAEKPAVENVPLNLKSDAVVTAPPADAWPNYRGNAQLQGMAAGKLPEKLELLWTFATEGPVKSSAVMSKGKAYIGSDDGHVYCLDLKSGKKLWSFKTQEAVESAPLLEGDRLYVSSIDSFIYCLDADSGEMKWKYETMDKVTASPNLTVLPDGRKLIVVGSHDMALHALDAATGKLAWKYETENFINATSAIESGYSIFGGCDGLLHVIRVTDGTPVRAIDVTAYVSGGAALVGTMAYLGHYGNQFIAVDMEQSKIVWDYTDKKSPFTGSPAVTADRVVFGGQDKNIYCVNRADGKVLWSFPTRKKVDSSPLIVDGKVLVGSGDGRVYLLNLEDGRELWSYEIGKAVTSSPGIAEGIVVIGGEDGSVYGFGNKEPSQKP